MYVCNPDNSLVLYMITCILISNSVIRAAAGPTLLCSDDDREAEPGMDDPLASRQLLG